MRWLAVVAAALGLTVACGGATVPRGRTAPSTRPVGGPEIDEGATTDRLVVIVIIDHFPQWVFERARPTLTRGFARLLAEGAWRTGRAPAIPVPLELGTSPAIVGLDAATAALASQRGGMLVVRVTDHDEVARATGHESADTLAVDQRIDEALETFLRALDERVGRGRWALALTSDHGGAPTTGRAGRITADQLRRAANAAAATNLGNGDWIAPVTPPFVSLTPAAGAANKHELTKAYRKIVFALRAFPGIALADRTDAYLGHCDDRDHDARDICLALASPAIRPGEFLLFAAPGWIIEPDAGPVATTHGSLQDYDRNVPVVLLPFGRSPHAPQSAPAGEPLPLSELAALLGSWLAR